MKLSRGVEWAVHCAVILAVADADVRASRHVLAAYHDLPEAYLAKTLNSLVRGRVFAAVSGPKGGFHLARPAGEITVLDIVEAVEGSAPTFTCAEIRQRGACALPPERCTSACPIAQVMYDADAAWRDSLRSVTVADIADKLPAWTRRRIHSFLDDPAKPLPPLPPVTRTRASE